MCSNRPRKTIGKKDAFFDVCRIVLRLSSIVHHMATNKRILNRAVKLTLETERNTYKRHTQTAQKKSNTIKINHSGFDLQ